jgi:hypothetical protein
MGFYHNEWFTFVVKVLTSFIEGAGLTPSRSAAAQLILPPLRVRSARHVGPAYQVGPTHGTHVPGRPDGWDPGVRPDRQMGPSCQTGPTDGTHLSDRTDGWDLVVRPDRWVGPTCQVSPTGGTRVSDRTDGWDPVVRPDRRMGPSCQTDGWDPSVRSDPCVRTDWRVKPSNKFKCMTRGSYTYIPSAARLTRGYYI